MNEKVISLFVNPDSKEKLEFDASQNIFRDTKTHEVFEILDNVIHLLPCQDTHYRKHYEEDAVTFDYFNDYNADHLVENERVHQKILEFISSNDDVILDVGCGNAWLAKELLPKHKTIISMDISTKNPKEAIKKFPSENHFAIVADAFHLPIKESSLDVVIASEIMEHVPNPTDFVSSLYKVLKPDGKLIITTPYNEKILKSLCVHCNQLTPHDAHLHSFNREKIKQILPSYITNYIVETFNHKLLINTGIYLKLKFLPFGIWKIIDKFSSFILPGKEKRMLTFIKK